MEDFSVVIVVGATYRFLSQGIGAFFRRVLPTLVCAALAVFLAFSDRELNLGGDTARTALAALIGLTAIFAAHFAIGWHRYALQPEIQPATGALQIRLILTYLRATATIVGLAALPLIGALMATAVLGSPVSIPAAVLAAFLVAGIIGKLALAWPAAATGRRHVLRHGWVMSSGLAPKLLLTLLLTTLPFDAAAAGLVYAIGELPAAYFWPLALAALLLVLIGKAAGATALSFAYRWRLRQDNSHWWRHAV